MSRRRPVSVLAAAILLAPLGSVPSASAQGFNTTRPTHLELRLGETRPADAIFENRSFHRDSQALFVDLNADGRPDMLWADDDLLHVTLNNGDGTFPKTHEFDAHIVLAGLIGSAPDGSWRVGLESERSVIAARFAAFSGHVAAGDLNGDGRNDLVLGLRFAADEAGTFAGAGLRVMLGTDETLLHRPHVPLLFVPAPNDQTFLPVTGFPNLQIVDLGLADTDGDGTLDLLALGRGKELFWLKGVGDGTFAAPRRLLDSRGANPTSDASLAVADFDRDGTQEILLCSENVEFLRYSAEQDNHGPVAWLQDPRVRAPQSCGIGDFDGDGQLDLVVSDDGRLSYLRGGGNLWSWEGPVEIPGAGVSERSHLHVADWNGDGLSDIAALEDRTLRVIRSVRDSGGWLGFAPPDDFSTRERENGPTLGTGRRHPGIADLDGDGFADFGYVGTFDERSYEPIILRSKPAATRAMADALETQVADLQQQLGTLPQQLAALTAEREGLLGTVAQLRLELAAATATIGSFRSTLAALQQEMSAVLKEPGFLIPGGTPELQLQNLFRGIAALNHGQRQALGKALKGS